MSRGNPAGSCVHMQMAVNRPLATPSHKLDRTVTNWTSRGRIPNPRLSQREDSAGSCLRLACCRPVAVEHTINIELYISMQITFTAANAGEHHTSYHVQRVVLPMGGLGVLLPHTSPTDITWAAGKDLGHVSL
jgi:hypothetical protein